MPLPISLHVCTATYQTRVRRPSASVVGFVPLDHCPARHRPPVEVPCVTSGVQLSLACCCGLLRCNHTAIAVDFNCRVIETHTVTAIGDIRTGASIPQSGGRKFSNTRSAVLSTALSSLSVRSCFKTRSLNTAIRLGNAVSSHRGSGVKPSRQKLMHMRAN